MKYANLEERVNFALKQAKEKVMRNHIGTFVVYNNVEMYMMDVILLTDIEPEKVHELTGGHLCFSTNSDWSRNYSLKFYENDGDNELGVPMGNYKEILIWRISDSWPV